MKNKISIFTLFVFLFILSLLPNVSSSKDFSTECRISNVSFKAEYTYERVFKDGIWWIYVYDGVILIAVYPED